MERVRFEFPSSFEENVGLGSLFQAVIYRSRQMDRDEVYRVVIGLYGTEHPGYVGEFLGFHEISDFMDSSRTGEWVRDQVDRLNKNSKRVEFDENSSYHLGIAMEQHRLIGPFSMD